MVARPDRAPPGSPRRCRGHCLEQEDGMHETVITRAGLARLSEELERLRTAGRRRIAERLERAAASEANRAESAEFLDAREEQALLERRIRLPQDPPPRRPPRRGPPRNWSP